MQTFVKLESEVRGYCRSFPALFTKARGGLLWDDQGREYIDFLMGAGTLNYGHNTPALKRAALEYLESDGIVHGLDLHTTAKKRFLEVFDRVILRPRGLEYKLQFPGPTGTNAVEAAFKLARNITGRTNILCFTNAFHGMTLGSVSATGNAYYRDAAGVPLSQTTFVPYDGYLGEDVDTLEYLRKVLEDSSSGVDLPAAVIVETIQGEGGVNIAKRAWLQGLESLCREFGILLIVDDIQVGCGRSGSFFSFEKAGLKPDIVLLSKSLSGFGLPLSVVLIRPDLDAWKPGQHNGTFRGNNLAFVTAARAIEEFWSDDRFAKGIQTRATLVRDRLLKIQKEHSRLDLKVRGCGLISGIECAPPELAAEISRIAFSKGLIIETSGAESQVVKCLPALNIEIEVLKQGLAVLAESFGEAVARWESGEILTDHDFPSGAADRFTEKAEASQ